MGRARWLGREVEFAPERAAYLARQALVDRLFAAAGVEVLDLGLCPAPRCPVARDGAPLYRDSNHLTASRARELGPVAGAGDQRASQPPSTGMTAPWM